MQKVCKHHWCNHRLVVNKNTTQQMQEPIYNMRDSPITFSAYPNSRQEHWCWTRVCSWFFIFSWRSLRSFPLLQWDPLSELHIRAVFSSWMHAINMFERAAASPQPSSSFQLLDASACLKGRQRLRSPLLWTPSPMAIQSQRTILLRRWQRHFRCLNSF